MCQARTSIPKKSVRTEKSKKLFDAFDVSRYATSTNKEALVLHGTSRKNCPKATHNTSKLNFCVFPEIVKLHESRVARIEGSCVFRFHKCILCAYALTISTESMIYKTKKQTEHLPKPKTFRSDHKWFLNVDRFLMHGLQDLINWIIIVILAYFTFNINLLYSVCHYSYRNFCNKRVTFLKIECTVNAILDAPGLQWNYQISWGRLC